MQAYAAYHLVRGRPRMTGMASGCQAFGHRELLAVLQHFGLAYAPVITGSPTHGPLQPTAPIIGSYAAPVNASSNGHAPAAALSL